MVQIHRSSNSFTQPTGICPIKGNKSATSMKRSKFNPSSPHSRSRGILYDLESDSDNSEFDEKKSIFPKESNILLIFVISVLCYFCYNNSNALKASANEISTLTADFSHLRGVIEETEDELEAAHYSFSRVKDISTTNSKDNEHDDYYFDFDLSEEERKNVAKDIIEKHDKQAEHIGLLQQNIQAFHRKELERRFGEGPYYVEFKILVEGMEMYFTVQTAPNEFMPHSVYTFMQMVDDGVWDNTVFIHHWNHIVQAAPISPDGNTKHDLIAYELTFPEYSDEYKHEQYTLGFSSQPGGPEFYINLMDNINSHGPGQQEHSTVLNDADPCFAKIVIGKNAFERLRQASADAESTEEIIFTTIEAVRRVTPTQEVFEA